VPRARAEHRAERPSDPPARGTSAAYLIVARNEPIPVDWDGAPSSEELDEDDFLEQNEIELQIEVELEELRVTNEVEHLRATHEVERVEAPAPLSVRPPVIPRLEDVARIEPASARYIVSPGARPGEVILRALEPGEPPPYGAPIAKLAPSCDLDTRSIAAMLNRRF
jgi:hypothetical protein